MANQRSLTHGQKPLQGPLHDGTCHLNDHDVGAGVGHGVSWEETESIFDRIMGVAALAFFLAGVCLLLLIEPLLTGV